MIHDELVTYEVAKLAREKGFNVPTDFCYEQNGCLVRCGSIAAPTQSLLQRWLREERGYYVYPFFDNDELKWTFVIREKTGERWIPLVGETPYFNDYEKVMEAGLKYALENLV